MVFVCVTLSGRAADWVLEGGWKVGSGAQPSPVTLAALHDELLLAVGQQAAGAAGETGTGGALRVVILPLATQAGRGGTALGAGHTPGG